VSGDAPGPRVPEDRLRALVEAVPLALFEVGPDGSWTFGNNRFREVLGLPAGESLAEGITRLIDPRDRDEVVARWQAATRSGEPFQVEFRLAGAGPAPRRIRARASPLRDPAGALKGYAGVLEDVTEDRRLEQLLLEEADRERDRSRRKSEFLAVMSHELRTPIHGVVGTAGLLQSTALSPDQREYVDMLVQSADATLSVINNVLDLSKIEAGKLELDLMDFDLRDLVEKSVSLFAARAHGKGLDLVCRYPGNVPDWVRGDPQRLRQVLVNFLSNAVKFTEKGGVVLTVSRPSPSKDGPDTYRFEVRDTGIGVSESVRGRLFAPFVQGDNTVSSRFGGTGLGLTICHQLVRLMDGVTGVDGEPGKGSMFWATALLGKPSAPPPPAHAVPEEAKGRRVLVVDDHEATRDALGDLLAGFDDLVLKAAGAAEGLAILRKGAADYEPVDVVVLDMHLPGEGEARKFVQAVRADPEMENVRIVLATSFGHRSRAEAAKWEGIAAFLAKPVRRADLMDCMGAAFSEDLEEPFGRTARSRAPAVSVSGSFRIARILVVDDNEVNRKIARRQLEQKGFLVETAVNGLEAVEMSSKVPYDIIFMDLMMPELDGFEATRQIREKEQGSGHRVPVVAMTARAMEGDRQNCIAHDMDDYLTKPVKFEDLDAVLDRWLAPRVPGGTTALGGAGARSATGTPPGRAGAPAGGGPSQAVTGAHDAGPLDDAVLDSLAALQAEGEGDIVKELVEIFLRETPPRFDKLRGFIEGEDAEGLHREAHGLKGTAASLGARRFSQIAKAMEEGGRAGSVEGADVLLRDLREEFERVAAALRARVAGKK
jgi:two-component system sensor histidine kinase/response regulator